MIFVLPTHYWALSEARLDPNLQTKLQEVIRKIGSVIWDLRRTSAAQCRLPQPTEPNTLPQRLRQSGDNANCRKTTNQSRQDQSRLHGGRSSVGRAPGCGPGGHGFEPRRSPVIFVTYLMTKHCDSLKWLDVTPARYSHLLPAPPRPSRKSRASHSALRVDTAAHVRTSHSPVTLAIPSQPSSIPPIPQLQA